jgi:Zn-dependent protease with chaperone function
MDSSRRRDLVGRATLAILLTLGFYGLAILIALGLLFIIYAEFALVGSVNIRLTLFALFGALAILWAIFPRIDRFVPPGPRLSPTDAPGLFDVIKKVSVATGQAMPREVYLVPDVNAFVAERGGMMGIGSRRVMGIGLPLLHLLSVDEIKAVTAHEFGHFYGGDTSLGPWIYKTRAAIIRTVASVGHASGLLQAPFVWYAKMFLKITNSVSRQQEYTADRLAARTVGAQATISGLQKIHRYALPFQSYFQQEYVPALNAGYQPPMFQGFELFLGSRRISEAIDEFYEKQVTEAQADPYDTHPSLKERLAALQDLPAGMLVDGRPASDLISTVKDAEVSLLNAIAVDKAKARSLKPIAWDQMTDLVLVPQWEASAKKYAAVTTLLTPALLPDVAHSDLQYFTKIAAVGNFLPRNVTPDQVSPEDRTQVISNVVGSALIVALRRRGWSVRTNPGEDVFLVKGDKTLQPFQVFQDLEKATLSAEEWEKTCLDLGISGIGL